MVCQPASSRSVAIDQPQPAATSSATIDPEISRHPRRLPTSKGPSAEAERERLLSLGAGIKVAYPVPTSEAGTRMGRSNRRSDTRPEVALRSELHRRGLRFHKDHRIDLPGGGVRADIVFPGARVAVFVDGCFWHACPAHGRTPRSNTSYWAAKLASNVARDRRVDEALREAGWRSVRAWEHEAPVEAALRLQQLLKEAADR